MPTADEILATSMGTAVADSAEIDDDAPSGAAEEALEDVHTRFILNLPDVEFESADRIFFQLEQGETTIIFIHVGTNLDRSGQLDILTFFFISLSWCRQFCPSRQRNYCIF